MKFLFILFGVVCLALVLLPSCAPTSEPEPEAAPEAVFDQSAEEAAIRKMMADSFTAHSNHDAKAMAAHWADGVIFYIGKWSREQLIKDAEETYAKHKDFRAEQVKEFGIDFLKPDVAIQRRISKYSGSPGPDGEKLPQPYLLLATVLTKKDGTWTAVAQFGTPLTDEEFKQLTDAQ